MLGYKPIAEMYLKELLKFVGTTSPKEDWERIFRYDREEYFYIKDTRLRIVHYHTNEGVQNENFQENWATKFPDTNAIGLWYDLEYDGSYIKRFIIVMVDGGRAYLPCPKGEPRQISKLQNTIGLIIASNQNQENGRQRYEGYLGRAKITVASE